jgi:hypothetical protein
MPAELAAVTWGTWLALMPRFAGEGPPECPPPPPTVAWTLPAALAAADPV